MPVHIFTCRFYFYFFMTILILIFFCSPAFSSVTGSSTPQNTIIPSEKNAAHDNAAPSDRSGDLKDLFYRHITFALVIIILFVIYKKMKIKEALSARSEEIRERLDELKRDKEDAEERCREAESRLREFNCKRDEIVEQYKKEGLAEKERILSEAKERVKKIIDHSEITIQLEIDSARKQLKQSIVDIAAEKAAEILMSEMTEDDQEKMIIEFVKKVGKAN